MLKEKRKEKKFPKIQIRHYVVHYCRTVQYNGFNSAAI